MKPAPCSLIFASVASLWPEKEFDVKHVPSCWMYMYLRRVLTSTKVIPVQAFSKSNILACAWLELRLWVSGVWVLYETVVANCHLSHKNWKLLSSGISIFFMWSYMDTFLIPSSLLMSESVNLSQTMPWCWVQLSLKMLLFGGITR